MFKEIKRNLHNDYAVISISGFDESIPDFSMFRNVLTSLTLQFDDEEEGITAMDKDDAQKIKKFVQSIVRMKNPNQEFHDTFLIVHCGAGISRSAGVAAAIGKFLFNDDFFIFNSPKFCPNRNCYRLTLNALFED